MFPLAWKLVYAIASELIKKKLVQPADFETTATGAKTSILYVLRIETGYDSWIVEDFELCLQC